MKKQLKKLIILLYYYWQEVDLAAYSPKELAAAGLNDELLLIILRLRARELSEVVPSDQQVKTAAVRALAHLRADAHPQAFSNDPEVVRRARRAISSLRSFHAFGAVDWRYAEAVTHYSSVPAEHISHDPQGVREVRRRAISITWAEYPWSVKWEWLRWIRLQQWLHNSGVKPEDVGIDAAVFFAEYRQAVCEHWAPALYEALNCTRPVCTTDHWHSFNPIETAAKLLRLIEQGVMSWEEAPCSRLELTGIVEALDQYPLEQARLLGQLGGSSRSQLL